MKTEVSGEVSASTKHLNIIPRTSTNTCHHSTNYSESTTKSSLVLGFVAGAFSHGCVTLLSVFLLRHTRVLRLERLPNNFCLRGRDRCGFRAPRRHKLLHLYLIFAVLRKIQHLALVDLNADEVQLDGTAELAGFSRPLQRRDRGPCPRPDPQACESVRQNKSMHAASSTQQNPRAEPLESGTIGAS